MIKIRVVIISQLYPNYTHEIWSLRELQFKNIYLEYKSNETEFEN